MTTLFILVGFAIMLFLPCAVALLGSLEHEDNSSAYSDRIVDPIVRSRVPQTLETSTNAQVETTQTPIAPARVASLQREKITDPVASRAQKFHLVRALRNEVEALLAHAAAARAQADALVANAYLATAQAEAADAQATLAEEAASAAIQEMRRAA
jgi:hypothetical protein